MTLAEFIAGKPCLEELDGYLNTLKPGSDARLLGIELSEGDLTAEVLRVSEAYRQRVLKGRVVPEPSKMLRSWSYQFGKAPTKRAEPPLPSPARSPAAAFGSASAAPPAGRADTPAKYLVAKPRW